MSPSERKQYLQSIGVLPPDPGEQVNPFAEAGLGPQAQAARNIQPDGGPMTPGDAESGPANPDDPREKLRQLMTPEMFQKLRARAYGGGSNGDPNAQP